MVALSVVMCLISGAMCWICLLYVDQHSPSELFEKAVCVQCSQLNMNFALTSEAGPLFEKLVKVTENGVLKCCAVNGDQMSALLELISMKSSLPKPAPERDTDFRFMPTSAHLTLQPSASISHLRDPVCGGGQKAYFNHDHLDPLIEHIQGVDVQNNSLVIQHTGLYMVYSSVHFRTVPNHSAGEYTCQSAFRYMHMIRFRSPRYSEILLETASTACENSAEGEETSFRARSFYLEAGDRIQVCFHDQTMIEFSKESTFVGLVMMTGAPI